MINTTFELNGEDWSDKLSTLSFRKIYPVAKEIRTLNGNSHVFGGAPKWGIEANFVPLNEDEFERLSAKISNATINVNSKPIGMSTDYRADYKMLSDLSGRFALVSVNGKTYYTDIMLSLEEM